MCAVRGEGEDRCKETDITICVRRRGSGCFQGVEGEPETTAYNRPRRDVPQGASIMALISEEFKKDFEEVWRTVKSLSASFPMPNWNWDVVRFELMAFLYAHALCFAQHKGKCVASLFPESIFKRVYADFLYEVERCVRFDICRAMRGRIDGDEKVEKLLEDRYAVYSPEIGKDAKAVAQFVCLVRCSLKDGVDDYDLRGVSKAGVNPVFAMELDWLMQDFMIGGAPVVLEMLISEEFLMSVEKKTSWVIRDEVLRFAELVKKSKDNKM